MKAGKDIRRWRLIAGAAGVSALALIVSVQGSPRVGAGERDVVKKSDASRVVRGPSTAIHSAIAQGGGATMSITPVNPTTQPPSSYPPGSTLSGQTLTLGSVPARVWLQVTTTGFPQPDWNGPDAATGVKTVQAFIDATDEDMDGGGYLVSECAGEIIDSADLVPAVQPCASNTDCRNAISGIAAPCPFGEPSGCSVGFCVVGFQDRCNPNWIAQFQPATCAVDTATENYRYGCTNESPSPIYDGFPMVDYMPSYFGTLVLDVPSGAKGTYTIDFKEDESFLTNFVELDIPITTFEAAEIVIPCGRCCRDEGTACDDGVSPAECQTAGGFFGADAVCPASGEICPMCKDDAQCSDGQFCNGAESCDPALGCVPGTPPCAPDEVCDEDSDACLRVSIPTVSAWGIAVLTLLLLVAAKLSFRTKSAAM